MAISTSRQGRVVASVNGVIITNEDILEKKRAAQKKHLARKRMEFRIIKPAHVWVFWTDGLGDTGFFMGYWTYIQTATRCWIIDRRYMLPKEIAIKAMSLFPCGLEPINENFYLWKEAFCTQYHKPTIKRPERNGLAVVDAILDPSGRELIDIELRKENHD